MKNKALNITFFVFSIFFLVPLCVKADFGDVRYDVTNVELNGEKITFKGWAFIHKTNNYTSVASAGLSGGDQKILMQAVKENGDVIETKVVSGSSKINYNFYCELFYKNGDLVCNESNYKKKSLNTCSINNESNGSSYCYYEDIYFSITFDTSTWDISNNENIKFKLAVSNAYFEGDDRLDKINYKYLVNGENRIGFEEKGDIYTQSINVSISNAAVSRTGNDYITIDSNSFDNKLKFIANLGRLLTPTNVGTNFLIGTTCAYGEYREGTNMVYEIANTNGYNNGRSANASTDRCYNFLGNDCKGTYYYAIKVNKNLSNLKEEICDIAIPCSGSNCTTAAARGSHVQPSGTTIFKIKVNVRNRCPVITPSSGNLQCNNSNTFTSNCDKLTVVTDKGRAEVKIEQTGTISSVLSPTQTYAGGGFNFGVMYYNTIKWDYVGTPATGALHTAVKGKMEQKIKDYDTYIAGINISNLKLNSQIPTGFSYLNKKCTASTNGKDYYKTEITVSCVFTFPEPKLHYNGTVTYTSGGNININNKYYTPIKYSGDYVLEANIAGMNRITDSSALNDSKEQGKAWTGIWEDTFEDCKVNLYPLLIKDGKNNFIYRPIDLNNPFPNNRTPGINWYDWISVPANEERLKNTYSDSNNEEYEAKLDNNAINNIKNYNKNHNYLDWSNIGTDEKSSFITENNYVDRMSGS